MKKAYLYIRVSTDEQADTGYSQRYQEETLRKYCENNHIGIAQVIYEDHSAKTFDRPEFQKLHTHIKRSKRDRADLLLVTKWDRFSRNVTDSFVMIRTLAKLGVEVAAIEQMFDRNVPENMLMQSIYLTIPQIENERRGLNIKGGMLRARKEGRVMGKAPLGYRNAISADRRKYIEIDPVQGPVMRWAFEEVARGELSVASILEKCKELGLKTNSGRPVCKTSLWTALASPVYMGMVRIKSAEGEDLVAGTHAPLITPALFHQVQDVLSGNSRPAAKVKLKENEEFPLRGFLLCPKCGRVMTASKSRGKMGVMYSYYHCYKGCNVRHKAREVNEAFIQELARLRPDPIVQSVWETFVSEVHTSDAGSRQKELNGLRLELQQLETYKERVRKLLIAGDLPPDDYRIEKEQTEARIAIVQDRLVTASNTDDLEQDLRYAFEVLCNIDAEYERADIERKREIVSSMFPEKFEFFENRVRTRRLNEVVALIFNVGAAFGGIKKPELAENSQSSGLLSFRDDFRTHGPNFRADVVRMVRLYTSRAA